MGRSHLGNATFVKSAGPTWRKRISPVICRRAHPKRVATEMSRAASSRYVSFSEVALSLSVALSLTSATPAAAEMARLSPLTTSNASAVVSVTEPRVPMASATELGLTTVSPLSPFTVSDEASSASTFTSTSTSDPPQSKHESLGEKLASYLHSLGVPDVATVFILSAMPIIELRAGVPVGFLLGLPAWQTFALAVAGNVAPILPTLLLLQLPVVRSLCKPVLSRASKLADGIGSASSRAVSLALFVGVPLPGTGAWTGTVIAFVLGMSIPTAFGALASGVVMAAIIMTALCELGWIGAAIASAVLGSTGVVAIVRSLKFKKDNTSSN